MLELPQFSRTARRQLLECGDLDWTDINPDIFGSMIQTIAQGGTRSDLGMHYTSVPNIMKVLEPLFLDDLKESYKKSIDSVDSLEALLGRLSRIRVFDPACGSGNFLIIAYKEMRKLEIEILKRIGEIAEKTPLRLSGISLHNFYGIDIVDFACETAKLSLWIAEHQMNSAFKGIFGDSRATLPLGKITTIRNGNSLRLDWLKVCPEDSKSETYICGNPPYLGHFGRTNAQNEDMRDTCAPYFAKYKELDYVACWLIKLAQYLQSVPSTVGAFVTTNSICQGEQVPILWPYMLSQQISIQFAHTTFLWSNSAAHNAGVACIIVGLTKRPKQPRMLCTKDHRAYVANINPYLVSGSSALIVTREAVPINGLPPLVQGSMANDFGHLMLSGAEARQLISTYPHARDLVRRFYNAEDFLYDKERYALWIPDERLSEALSMPPIADRIRKVRADRLKSNSDSLKLADTPHRFGRIVHQEQPAIAVPQTSTSRREYLPIGLLDKTEIAGVKLYVMYAPPPYMLSLLSSRLHLVWMATIGGRLKHDYSYSITLVYNTLPIPDLSAEQKRSLSDRSRDILKARARNPGKTLAWLYDPDTMPNELRKAHEENDLYIEQHIYGRTFKDDSHRLEHLFSMYARLKKARDADGTLFSSATEQALA